jgi:hypothetical protein
VLASHCQRGCHCRQIWSKTQNTNKKLCLASAEAKTYENYLPLIGPYTQLINETSLVKMQNAIIGAEELTYISSYQTLQEDKIWKSYY